MVGEGTDQIGARMSPAATGILQSGLGNLPELFIAIFSLQAGLVVVVQSALIGSILANSLLVLGIAFLVGGLRHGTQRFEGGNVRAIAMLLLLAVGRARHPDARHRAPGAPDVGHAAELSVVVSIVLLVGLRGLGAVSAVRHPSGGATARGAAELEAGQQAWPLPLALGILALCRRWPRHSWLTGSSKRPARLWPRSGCPRHSQALVVVAIAGNAVENVVGVTAAARDKAELAVSLILNSSLQAALALTPALVLLSMVMGGGPAHPGGHAAAGRSCGLLGPAGLLVIVFDGESNWLEGPGPHRPPT